MGRDPSEIHHCHAMANMSYDAQVMRDEDEGDAHLLLEIHPKLRICACTETSRADAASPAMMRELKRQRPRDVEPLALTARRLGRKPVHDLRRQSVFAQKVRDKRSTLLPAEVLRVFDRFGDDLCCSQARAQGQVRILEHHLHPARQSRRPSFLSPPPQSARVLAD